MSTRVLSFDAETNGLWGQPFAIGALVYDENGVEVERFVGRCPIQGEVVPWVAENVLPQLAELPVYGDWCQLLSAFAKFYLANKDGADQIVHMGYIVEAKLLRDMYSTGMIGEWDGPYPLIDIAGNLQQVGEDPTSVDSYVQKWGLEVRDFGGTHNPLHDSEVAAVVYRHLLGRRV